MKNEEFVMRHHCAAKFFILSHLFKLLFAERRLHNHSFQLTSPHVNADFRTDLAVFGSDIPHSDTNLTGRRHSSGGNHTDGNTVCTDTARNHDGGYRGLSSQIPPTYG